VVYTGNAMITRRLFTGLLAALAACKVPTTKEPHMTTKVIVKAGGGSPQKGKQIGEIQTILLHGMDPHPTGKVLRMRIKREMIDTIFMNGTVSSYMRWPMDIDIIDSFGVDESVTTTVENVWIKDLGYAFTSSEYVIVDQFTFEAENIYAH
jgi:hypothetical protein